jgi:membrane-bound serine protease (ClpP class)
MGRQYDWRRVFTWCAITLIGLAGALRLAIPDAVLAQQNTNHVDLAEFNTSVDLFTAGYVERTLGLAQADGAQAYIIELDTPGGELDATHDIIKALLASPLPTVVYIAPSGARAGSAGTFITYAADIAAMAPGTNIGAAHPVDLGGGDITGTIGSKVTNDAIAQIQTLANQHGRNADWAARAVSESVSIPEYEAIKIHVVDLISTDREDLLNQLDGRTINKNGRSITLHTRGAAITELSLTIVEEILHVLLDPNIATILFSIGSLAILVELYNPGAVLPAVVGVIFVTLSLVSLYNLPTNWAALILIVAAIIMFILDVKVTSFVLTLGAIVAFVLGALFLFRPFTLPGAPAPEVTVAVSPFVIAGLTGLMVLFFLVIIRAAVRSRLMPVVSGAAPFYGASGVATSELNPNGTVRVRSEDWTATSEAGPIHKGEKIKVLSVDGLRLHVAREE